MKTRTLEELENLIVKAATAYYEGHPFISDEEFDNYTDELAKRNPGSEIFDRPGWGYVPENSDLSKIHHFFVTTRGFPKMKLSSEDVVKPITQVITAFEDSIITPKYDGANLTLYYNKFGLLEKAITRGDGANGTDVTRTVSQIVPMQVSSGIYAITGEWILSNEDFEENYEVKSDSQRNIATGVLMRKVPSPIEELKRFSFVAYRIIAASEKWFNSHSEKQSEHIRILRDLGFVTPPYYVATRNEVQLSYEDFLKTFRKDIHSNGKTYSYDGIVVNNNFTMPIEYTFTNDKNDHIFEKSYVYQYVAEIALKTITESADVIVRDISWNLTRTSRLVPTVKFDPVFISGASVSRASGFNAKYIKDNSIDVGAEIEVVRSGEVIPYIVGVKTPVMTNIPTHCPSCSAELEWSGTDLVCENPNCPSREINRLYHFLDTVGGEKGISSQIIYAIIEVSGETTIPEFLSLKNTYTDIADELCTCLEGKENIGSAKISLARNLLNRIFKEKIEFRKYVVGLSLSNIGWTTSDKIKSALWEACISEDYDRVITNSGLTPSIKTSLLNNEDLILKTFNQLSDRLIDPREEEEAINHRQDYRFGLCITGKLTSGTKQSFYQRYSGICKESTVNNCEILIANSEGSGKWKTAKKLNKTIMTEDEFEQRYGGVNRKF
jgi:DNA ligase (NAD+)